MAFEVYLAPDGYRWRLVADNGEIIASGEAYTRERDVYRAIKALRGLVWRAPVTRTARAASYATYPAGTTISCTVDHGGQPCPGFP